MDELPILCKTPSCAEAVANEAELRARCIAVPKVYAADYGKDIYPDAIARCDGCGGFTDGENWWHRCWTCKRDVEPGELVGLFVPTLCRECDAKKVAEERAKGQVCRRCRTVFSYCCC